MRPLSLRSTNAPRGTDPPEPSQAGSFDASLRLLRPSRESELVPNYFQIMTITIACGQPSCPQAICVASMPHLRVGPLHGLQSSAITKGDLMCVITRKGLRTLQIAASWIPRRV